MWGHLIVNHLLALSLSSNSYPIYLDIFIVHGVKEGSLAFKEKKKQKAKKRQGAEIIESKKVH